MLSAFQNEEHISPRESSLKRKIYHYKSKKISDYYILIGYYLSIFFKISYLKSKKK